MLKIISIFVVFFLGACNTPKEGAEGKVKTLNIAVPIEMVDLSPFGVFDTHSIRVRDQIFDNLFEINSNGQIVSSLALTFTNITDTTIQITLRSNVVFHNGDPFTAEDVKYTIDTALDTPALQSILSPLKEVKILSPYVIQVILKAPYAPVQILFTGSSVLVVNKKAAESGDFSIGTGPFKFSEWNKGQNVVLERFDDYWGEPAKVNKLNIKTVPEALVRMIAVETGEADVAYDIDYAEKQRVLDSQELQFGESIIPRIEYIGFNVSKYPYNNTLFRQAIAYALDTPGILSSAVLGAGEQAYSISVPGIGHTKAPLLKQDIAKAKQLLKESGVPIGTKITLLAVDGVRKSISEVVQANLKEIGIDLEISVVEWAKYASMVYAVDTEMFMGGWSIAPDADLFYSVFFHTDNIGAGGNFTDYSNKTMDDLLDKARAELNPVKRQKYYDQIHNITMEEKVLIPLYYPINTIVYRSNVKVTRFDPYALHSWEMIEKK